MAVDKLSDHLGNHEGRYTDLDGQTKQFTYIDHDPKPKVGSFVSPADIDDAKVQLRAYRERLIEKIMNLPPTAAPDVFYDFTVRGDVERVTWNESMLRDEGLPLERLMEIERLVSNRLATPRY